MAVAYTTHNRILTVTLSGEIDHHRVKGVLQDLDQAIDEVLPPPAHCGLRRSITFMDSSGIAVLLRLWQRMEALEGSIQVTGLPEQPARVLRAAGPTADPPHLKGEYIPCVPSNTPTRSPWCSLPVGQRVLCPVGGRRLRRPAGPHPGRAGGREKPPSARR